MDTRSTNARFVHFTGDVISHVDSSHGVRLGGGSTGGVVETFADDANAALRVRAKGTGNLILGDSSQATRVGASTTVVSLLQRYLVQYTVPALSSVSASASTVAVTGLTTNSILTLTPRQQTNSTVVGLLIEPRCSSADELVLTFINPTASSLSGSTQSAYLLQTRVESAD